MKLLIATHAQAATGLLSAFSMIAGDAGKFDTCVLNESGIDDFRVRLLAQLNTYGNEDILILADVKGGTPFNESYAYGMAHPEHTAVVSGVNLPMLLEVGTTVLTGQTLTDIAQLAVSAGTSGITQAELNATDDDDDEMEF